MGWFEPSRNNYGSSLTLAENFGNQFGEHCRLNVKINYLVWRKIVLKNILVDKAHGFFEKNQVNQARK